MIARPIPKDNRVLKLMVGYATMLNGQDELATAELRRMVATHMHSLAALLLGGDGGLGLHECGLRAARLRSIKKHSISAVAYEAGFGDLSYFNRTFRRRYGATPSDIRHGARRLKKDF